MGTSGPPTPPLDGDELRELVEGKWGKAYDTRLHRRRDGLGQMRIYLEVMWKHLHQRSFHLSEAQYMEQLDAVAELCSLWAALRRSARASESARSAQFWIL